MQKYVKVVIATLLLGFYCFLICKAVYFAENPLSEQETQVLTLISGLVTSLVIAELALSDQSALVSGRLLFEEQSEDNLIVKYLTTAYVFAWFVFGGVAFFSGYMYPGDNFNDPTVLAIGKSYLGLVIGATYALFGIKPSKPKS